MEKRAVITISSARQVHTKMSSGKCVAMTTAIDTDGMFG
jgi:hypothetical protein